MMRLALLSAFLILVAFPVRGDILHGFAPEIANRALAYGLRRLDNGPDGESLLFELRAGDCASPKDCRTARERAELRRRVSDPLEQDIWYAFSMRLPSDYPELSPKQILGQWFDGGHPVLYNRYEEGRFSFFMITTEPRATIRCDLPEFEKGRWNRFVYRVRWSEGGDGRVTVWHDGEPVFALAGRTLSPNWRHGPKFKLGIYRSNLERLQGKPAPVQRAEFKGLVRIEAPADEAAQGSSAGSAQGILAALFDNEPAGLNTDASMAERARRSPKDPELPAVRPRVPSSSDDALPSAIDAVPRSGPGMNAVTGMTRTASDGGSAMTHTLAQAMVSGSTIHGAATTSAMSNQTLDTRAGQQVWCRSQRQDS